MALFSDHDALPETFDQWLALAEQAERGALAAGLTVRKVIIDPDEIVAFRIATGKSQIDAAARIAFYQFQNRC